MTEPSLKDKGVKYTTQVFDLQKDPYRLVYVPFANQLRVERKRLFWGWTFLISFDANVVENLLKSARKELL